MHRLNSQHLKKKKSSTLKTPPVFPFPWLGLQSLLIPGLFFSLLFLPASVFQLYLQRRDCLVLPVKCSDFLTQAYFRASAIATVVQKET
jgi:hypothetical protein